MEGKPKAEDKLNLVNIVTVGVVGALLVWVSIIALQAYYKNTLDSAEEARWVENQSVELRGVHAEQSKKIQTYGTRDDALRKKKVVTIPVAEAMELVTEELKRNPKASVVPDVGEHDQPTVEATPPYKAIQQPAPGGAAPAGEAGGEGEAQPTDGAGEGDAPSPPDDATEATDGQTAPAENPAGATKPAATETKPAGDTEPSQPNKPAAGETKPAQPNKPGAETKPKGDGAP